MMVTYYFAIPHRALDVRPLRRRARRRLFLPLFDMFSRVLLIILASLPRRRANSCIAGRRRQSRGRRLSGHFARRFA